MQRKATRTRAGARVRMMKRCTSGQFDLRHFESEPTARGRVLKRWDVGRVLRGPRHITSGWVRGLMMDETGDYACGNHYARCSPFETPVCARVRACMRACARDACTYTGGYTGTISAPAKGIARVPSYPAGSRLRGRMMEMNFLKRMHGASIIWQPGLIAPRAR